MDARPDGFVGAIMAIEGIKDAEVILHGPDGCRKNLNILSSKSYPRPKENMNIGVPFYRGSSRIPCTGIISTDYIYGSYDKIESALEFVGRGDSEFIAVVCSPGASLIGDDCNKAISVNKLDSRAISLDASMMSEPLSYGIDHMLADMVSLLAPSDHIMEKNTVNILGLSVLQKDWPTVIEEFTEILSLMGLKVICTLGAGCTIDEVKRSVNAEYDLVLCPEYADETSKLYTEEYGIKEISLGYSPIGFDATDALIRLIEKITGMNGNKALTHVDKYRKRAFFCMNAMRADLKGDTFAIDKDASVAYPLARWMFESFSMVPVSIRLYDSKYGRSEEILGEFLKEHDLENTINAELPEFVNMILCDGNTAMLEQASKHCRKGIDIRFPSVANVDFRPSPIFGAKGAMYLLDRIINPM